jgi:hypothetical protein
MRRSVALFAIILLASGCSNPPENPDQPPNPSLPGETTTTTNPATPTTHKIMPIKPLGVTSTSTTSTSTSTTTSSTVTTTTVILDLRLQQTATVADTLVRLQAAEKTGSIVRYTIGYRTRDGASDTVALAGKAAFADHLEAEAMDGSSDERLRLRIGENPEVAANSPPNATPMMLGGGLKQRGFAGFEFTLDSLQSERAKIRLKNRTYSLNLDMARGDVAFVGGVEIGLIDSRIPGGYALIYLLNDAKQYSENGGVRYCLRGNPTFPAARSVVLRPTSNQTYADSQVSLAEPGLGAVGLKVTGGEGAGTYALSCGTSLESPRLRASLAWYGGPGGTAKVILQGEDGTV